MLRRSTTCLTAALAGPLLWGVACSDFKGANLDDGGASDGSSGDASAIDGGGQGDGQTDGSSDAAPSDAGGDGSAGGRVCTATACTPVTMAGDLRVPFNLAVNATHIYWLERGTGSDAYGELVRIAKSTPCVHADGGCRGILDGLVAGQAIDYTTLGLGPGDVCYTQTYNTPPQHSLDCISLGTGVKRGVYQGAGVGVEISVLSDAIVWADYGTTAPASNGSIFRVAEDASFSATPPSVATNRPGPESVAVEADRIYWSEVGPGDGGSVMSAYVDGGGRAPLAQGRGRPQSVVLYGNYVYFADYSTGIVARVKKDGTGSVEPLATSQVSPFAIAVDASGVFWANAGSAPDYLDGTVHQCGLAGGAVTEMMAGVSSISALAIDGGYVYVASMGTQAGGFTDGKILRVDKTY